MPARECRSAPGAGLPRPRHPRPRCEAYGEELPIFGRRGTPPVAAGPGLRLSSTAKVSRCLRFATATPVGPAASELVLSPSSRRAGQRWRGRCPSPTARVCEERARSSRLDVLPLETAKREVAPRPDTSENRVYVELVSVVQRSHARSRWSRRHDDDMSTTQRASWLGFSAAAD